MPSETDGFGLVERHLIQLDINKIQAKYIGEKCLLFLKDMQVQVTYCLGKDRK